MSKYIKTLTKSGLIVSALAVLALPMSALAGVPSPDAPLDRLEGPDRDSTAVAISMEMHPTDNMQDYVFLTRNNEPTDALAAAPLARVKDAAILSTPTDSLSDVTRDEIERTLKVDADLDDVIILGGTAAVSQAVEDAVKAIDPAGKIGVKRYAGANRIKTAEAIWEALEAIKGTPSKAFLVTADNWPDALGVGAIAGNPALAGGYNPILPTYKDTLPTEVSDYLTAKKATLTTIYVLGGEAVISPTVYSLVDNIITTTERIAGDDRYETNFALNEKFHGVGNEPTKIGVATGEVYADALGLGVFMASKKAPLVLTKKDTVPSFIASYLTSYKATIGGGWLAGGKAAVTDSTKLDLESFYM